MTRPADHRWMAQHGWMDGCPPPSHSHCHHPRSQLTERPSLPPPAHRNGRACCLACPARYLLRSNMTVPRRLSTSFRDGLQHGLITHDGRLRARIACTWQSHAGQWHRHPVNKAFNLSHRDPLAGLSVGRPACFPALNDHQVRKRWVVTYRRTGSQQVRRTERYSVRVHVGWREPSRGCHGGDRAARHGCPCWGPCSASADLERRW